MARPLCPSPASVRPAAAGRAVPVSRIGAAGRARRGPLASRSTARRAGPALALVVGLFQGGAGCARHDVAALSAEHVANDRVAREAVLEAIERDHAQLALLIASDRFEQPKAIYADPELRALALHLIEQTRKLRDLAGTDFLAPGEP